MIPVTGPMWLRGWVEVQLYSSTAAALEVGEWSAARPGRTLPPGKTRYPFYRRLDAPQGRSGWAKNLVPTWIRSRTVQPAVSRYTDWATRTIILHIMLHNIKILVLWGHRRMRGPSLTEESLCGAWPYSESLVSIRSGSNIADNYRMFTAGYPCYCCHWEFSDPTYLKRS